MFPNGRRARDWPRVIRNGGGREARAEVARDVRVRAGQVGPEAARVGDGELDADRLVRRAHGVRHDIADEGLAEAADVVAALVEPCDRLGRGPDLRVQDRRELCGQLVDLGLDGRDPASGRSSTACGSRPSCRRRRPCRLPTTRRIRVNRRPLPRFSVTRTPFERRELTCRSLWSPMTASTLTTPSARSINGPVGFGHRAGRRALVAEGDDHVGLLGDPGCLGIDRRQDGSNLEGSEVAREDDFRRGFGREADERRSWFRRRC